MRTFVTIVVILGALRAADACPVTGYRDTTHVADGAPRIRLERWDEPLFHASMVRAVFALPARPSLYVHLAGVRDLPSFEDEHGQPVPFVAVPTGFASIPIRLDFLATSGVIVSGARKWEIDPAHVPSTRSVSVSRSVGKHDTLLTIDSDAAVFRVERDDGSTSEAWSWNDVWSDGYRARTILHLDHVVRVVAMYPDRTEEVIFERRSDGSYAAVLDVIALLGLLVLARWRPPIDVA